MNILLEGVCSRERVSVDEGPTFVCLAQDDRDLLMDFSRVIGGTIEKNRWESGDF